MHLLFFNRFVKRLKNKQNFSDAIKWKRQSSRSREIRKVSRVASYNIFVLVFTKVAICKSLH